MKDLHIEEFQKKESPLWDQFVSSHPEGSFYHLTAWKESLENAFGFQPEYLLARDGTGQIKGIAPLFQMRDILHRRYLISLPFSNFSSILADNEAVRQLLFKKIKDLAVARSVRYVELRQLGEKFKNLPSNTDMSNLFLDLSLGEQEIWDHSLRSNKRNKIRKAKKLGLQAKFGAGYLEDFYRIFSINMSRLGTPPFPLSFFEKIVQCFQDQSKIIVVQKDSKIIAGMLLIFFNQTMAVPWADSLFSYNHYAPNELMYWTAIQYGCSKGMATFDLGRSARGSGTYHFKIQWGAKPKTLSYDYILIKAKSLSYRRKQIQSGCC